jgi:dihydropyrimidine dehydrogenase (NAD+) subunit PreT
MTPEEFERNFAEIHPPFTPQEAVVEANRCLFCFDAPCTNACPTHIDVPRFIKKIATGNVRGSAQTILEANVLGLSCSRVCPVDVLCEGACVMHRYNKAPIEIGRLQRHAMDYFYDRVHRLPEPAPFNGKRVACVGAGPASLACAAELRRHGFAVTIFDKHQRAGGLNTYGVAEYKFRPADSQHEVELIRSLGVEFRTGLEVGKDISLDELEISFDVIFLGAGLGPTQELQVPGEHLQGVFDALQFIAAYKTAKPLPMGRRVAVIGGGNTAIDAATASRRLGAAEVVMLYRRGEKEMPAFEFEFEHAKRDGVGFLWLTQPVAIVGNGHVEAVQCQRMELAAEGPGARPVPRPAANSEFRVACDTVITSIGQSRLAGLLSQCRGVELRNGNVVADAQTGRTTNPKYFAGGDCVNGGREVVDAVAEGKRAAGGIIKELGVKTGEAHHG